MALEILLLWLGVIMKKIIICLLLLGLLSCDDISGVEEYTSDSSSSYDNPVILFKENNFTSLSISLKSKEKFDFYFKVPSAGTYKVKNCTETNVHMTLYKVTKNIDGSLIDDKLWSCSYSDDNYSLKVADNAAVYKVNAVRDGSDEDDYSCYMAIDK